MVMASWQSRNPKLPTGLILTGNSGRILRFQGWKFLLWIWHPRKCRPSFNCWWWTSTGTYYEFGER